MSSPGRSRRILLIASLLAVAAGPGACGGDEEGEQAAAETAPAVPSTTSSTAESTAPSTTASEQPARRERRGEEGERRRRRPEKHRSATEPKPKSPREETTKTPPDPDPEPKPEPKPKPEPERTTPKRAAPPAEDEPRNLFIQENATLKLVRRKGVTYWQDGTVKGTLSGTIVVKVTIGGPGVISTFTVALPNGTIRGRGEASVRPAGSVVHYKGTATITGGTGKYAKASGRDLGYSGKGAADASTATARLTGKLRY